MLGQIYNSAGDSPRPDIKTTYKIKKKKSKKKGKNVKSHSN